MVLDHELYCDLRRAANFLGITDTKMFDLVCDGDIEALRDKEQGYIIPTAELYRYKKDYPKVSYDSKKLIKQAKSMLNKYGNIDIGVKTKDYTYASIITAVSNPTNTNTNNLEIIRLSHVIFLLEYQDTTI